MDPYVEIKIVDLVADATRASPFYEYPYKVYSFLLSHVPCGEWLACYGLGAAPFIRKRKVYMGRMVPQFDAGKKHIQVTCKESELKSVYGQLKRLVSAINEDHQASIRREPERLRQVARLEKEERDRKEALRRSLGFR